jgi:hypothetical protein
MMPLMKARIPYVIGIQGAGLGTGKTQTLVALASLAYSSGFKINTNISSLKLPHSDFYTTVLPNLDEIISGRLKPPAFTFYALDDINKIVESRRAMRDLELKLSQFIQDIRKYDSMCAFSVPHLMWTDVRWYDLTDLVIYTTFDEGSSELHWAIVDPNYSRFVINRMTFNAEPLFDLYDSWEKVKVPSLEDIYASGIEFSDLTCKACGSSQVRTNTSGLRRCVRCGYSWKVKVNAR